MKKFLSSALTCPLFDDISPEEAESLFGCLGARVECFEKRDTVFAEGDPAHYVGIVLSGAVQIIQVDYFGNRSILSTSGKGELFGEAFACAGVDHLPISAVASESSEIMLIEVGRILHTCSKSCSYHRTLIYNMMRELAAKTLAYHERIEVTSARTTRDKLLTYLLHEARRAGSASFTIPFDRQELADYLEVDRSGLSAQIGRLCREGVIDCHKSHFVLHSFEG